VIILRKSFHLRHAEPKLYFGFRVHIFHSGTNHFEHGMLSPQGFLTWMDVFSFQWSRSDTPFAKNPYLGTACTRPPYMFESVRSAQVVCQSFLSTIAYHVQIITLG
jgi:hypothetical protein